MCDFSVDDSALTCMGVAGVYHFRVKKTFRYDFTNERDSPILDDYTTSEMITDEEDRTLDVLHALKDVDRCP